MFGFFGKGLIGAIVVGLVSIFFPVPNVSYWMSWLAPYFSSWILYDTSVVMRQYYQDDNVVGAVLNLYQDILNVFLCLLRVLGNRSRD